MSGRGVVLCHSTSAVLRAEKVLRKAGLEVRVAATPRELSSDCGISLRFPLDRIDAVRRLLDEAQVDVEGIHALA